MAASANKPLKPAFDIHGEILRVCSVCLLLFNLIHRRLPKRPAAKGGNAQCAVQAGTAHSFIF